MKLYIRNELTHAKEINMRGTERFGIFAFDWEIDKKE